MVLWIIVSSVLFHALQVSLITTEHGDIRLVGGTSRCTGVVEMKHQGVWRSVWNGYVTWTSQTSSVVCRQLGCGSDGSGQGRSGSTDQPVWGIYPSCKGSESAVVECRGTVLDRSSYHTVYLTCSVHGGWTGWSSWSQCSTSCIPEGSASTRTRSRSCTNPAPSSSGNSCVGEANETGRCDHLTSCPVHGGWTGWSSWSQCSTSCIPEGSASTRTRSRSCTNPAPSSSGNSCVGEANETGRCDHLTSCPALQVQPTVHITVSGDVRLVGGISNCTGTLEVKYQEEWRPATDLTSDLNLKSSSVVCRQLNCSSAVDTKWTSGSARKPVWMMTSSCNGSETSLEECVTMQSVRSVERQEVICSALFSQCGRAEPGAASRILGGRGSVPGTHPWQVSLQRRTKGSSEDFKHSCGGVLIASCWVLTAAHCINSSMEMQVVLGGVYLKKVIEESDQVIPVVRDILHPDYREKKTPNDVALLQLNATYSPLCAMETRYVKTACLPNQLFPDDMECVVTGWGRTGNNKRSNRLLEARTPLISKQSCMAPHVYGDRLDDTMICAGHMEGGVDTCQGDSGGPLVCEQDGVHYIAGVVSWGEGCAERNKPGVYANVHKYVTWINQMMSNDHSDNSEDYDYSYDD